MLFAKTRVLRRKSHREAITKLRIVGTGFSHAAINALDRACMAAPSRLQYRLPRIHASRTYVSFFYRIRKTR